MNMYHITNKLGQTRQILANSIEHAIKKYSDQPTINIPSIVRVDVIEIPFTEVEICTQ
jgi:hypothetical protein